MEFNLDNLSLEELKELKEMPLMTIEEMKEKMILLAYKEFNGRTKFMAKSLGMSGRRVNYYKKKLGLSSPEGKPSNESRNFFGVVNDE
jgi:transcriptional regulator with AAA-type ATPase domain